MQQQFDLRTQESRRTSYNMLKALGLTRTDVAVMISAAIKAGAKDKGWSENEIGSMLLELNSDLDKIYGPTQ